MVKSNNELLEIINYERRLSMFRVEFGYDLKDKIKKKAKKIKKEKKLREKLRSDYKMNIKAHLLANEKRKLKFVNGVIRDDYFIISKNYVQYKISEKDKEIEELKQQLKAKEDKEKSVKSRIDDMKDTYQLGDCHSGTLVHKYKRLRRVAGLADKYTGYNSPWN